jgi:type II secretory pathway pseudopilin PulG
VFYLKKKISAIRGFTLAEIMLGMFLLGIVLVTVTGVFVSGLSGARKAQKKIITINLAEGMLDSILLLDYSNVTIGDYDGTKSTPDPKVGNFPPDPYPQDSSTVGKVKYKVSVLEKGPGTGTKIKQITVEVLIEGIKGQGNSKATLTGFKAE